MTRLVIATTNRGKVSEIRDILAGVPFELVTLADLAPIAPPEETGRTFAENAQAKALYYASADGVAAAGLATRGAGGALIVAEDSGLEIDALGGRPGVESARLGGAEASYPDKFALLYEALRSTPPPARTARFVCALAVVAEGVAEGAAEGATEGRVIFEARGTIEGLIAPAPAGTGGFGYDPIFFYPPFGCTLAEAGPAKSTVSHRGKASRQLRAFLENWSGCLPRA